MDVTTVVASATWLPHALKRELPAVIIVAVKVTSLKIAATRPHPRVATAVVELVISAGIARSKPFLEVLEARLKAVGRNATNVTSLVTSPVTVLKLSAGVVAMAVALTWIIEAAHLEGRK